ncbi:MAG TPA: hypothetical protein VMD59_18095 [Acidimicrobiales bacterium]|nr:hypothetical protein [Acidimicrobiales bacterium]
MLLGAGLGVVPSGIVLGGLGAAHAPALERVLAESVVAFVFLRLMTIHVRVTSCNVVVANFLRTYRIPLQHVTRLEVGEPRPRNYMVGVRTDGRTWCALSTSYNSVLLVLRLATWQHRETRLEGALLGVLVVSFVLLTALLVSSRQVRRYLGYPSAAAASQEPAATARSSATESRIT